MFPHSAMWRCEMHMLNAQNHMCTPGPERRVNGREKIHTVYHIAVGKALNHQPPKRSKSLAARHSWYTPVIPAPRMLKQDDCLEFQTSLDYIASSRTP